MLSQDEVMQEYTLDGVDKNRLFQGEQSGQRQEVVPVHWTEQVCRLCRGG